MDKMTSSPMDEFIHSVSKQIVQIYYPEELSYFNPIWKIMNGIISELKQIGFEKWGLDKSQNKLMTSLGFADPSRIPDLTTPIIIGVLAASIWHIGTLRDMPKREDVENIIEKYCGRFGATGKTENILKASLSNSELLSILKKENIWNAGDRQEEGKVKESEPKAISDEDTLEIGFSEGKPFVRINGREVKQFRTKIKQFANLVLIAIARMKENGWIDKEKLDLGQNDQALAEIRGWISPSLINDISPKDVIKADTEVEGRIRIEAIYPQNIKIDKSICGFRTKSEKRVENLVNEANKRTLMWEKGIRKKLLNKAEFEQLERESEIMRKQMKLVQEGVEKLGWELNDKRWESLWSRCDEILDKCKYKRKYS